MNIIVVDDHEELRYSVKKILSENNHSVHPFEGNEENLVEQILDLKPSLILLDVQLKGKSGIDILYELKEKNSSISVVLMTAYTTPTNIIEATKLGVRDVLQKPFEAEYLNEIVQTYVKSFNEQSIELSLDSGKETFVGSYKTMGEIYKKVGMVASNDLSVMIQGETGTGKELIAKLIHAHSNRVNYPFIAINCAAIPNELFEGEFFGYEKGSFTGAQNRHIGYLESANGGVVFLDEIGEMPLFMQAKLLRFLESKTIKRLGATQEISLDVKVVSATNIDIKNSIAKEQFREDLYHRLSPLQLELPSLRDRVEDIQLLVSHFIKRSNKELHSKVHGITKDAMEHLKSYPFEGNVRELKNIITNAVLNASSENITMKDLKLNFGKVVEQKCDMGLLIERILDEKGIESASQTVQEFEKKMIESVIKRCEGNLTKSAEILQMARNTLKSKLG